MRMRSSVGGFPYFGWAAVLVLGLGIGACGRTEGASERPPREPPPRETSSAGAPEEVLPEPNFGEIRLSRGFLPDPHVVTGTSRGSVEAKTRADGCGGWISKAPDHVLVVGDPLGSLRILAWSERDVTLVLRTPGGLYRCSDGSGVRAVVDLEVAPAGRYPIWVGRSDSRDEASYRLGLSELASTRPEALATD